MKFLFEKTQKSMTEGHIFLILLGIVVLAGVVASVIQLTRQEHVSDISVHDFASCTDADNPVMESYPRQCRAKDGRVFVEEVSDHMSQPDNSIDDTPFEDTENVISIPPQPLSIKHGACAVAGCSGTLCVEADIASTVITTCEFRSSYVCYDTATCERQANGQCGWTRTPALDKCLLNTIE
jgi:hypothetical protein